MKKIVPKLLVISSQILIGALFLVFTINGQTETSLKVNSSKMERLSQFVYDEVGKETEIEINQKVEKDVFKKQEEKIIFEEISESVLEDEVKETVDIVEEEDNYFMDKEVLSTYTGILTGYGPDCVGCGNYNTNKVSTASGYHIADIVDGVIQPAFTITYDDIEFGEVRIVAGDSTLPYNTIVRITIPEQEPIIAIVLDRGSTVGFENCRSPQGCLTNFDLLFSTESDAIGKTLNVIFEILRMGK